MHGDGTSETLKLNHSFSAAQLEWFRKGSALNLFHGAAKKPAAQKKVAAVRRQRAKKKPAAARKKRSAKKPATRRAGKKEQERGGCSRFLLWIRCCFPACLTFRGGAT